MLTKEANQITAFSRRIIWKEVAIVLFLGSLAGIAVEGLVTQDKEHFPIVGIVVTVGAFGIAKKDKLLKKAE